MPQKWDIHCLQDEIGKPDEEVKEDIHSQDILLSTPKNKRKLFQALTSGRKTDANMELDLLEDAPSDANSYRQSAAQLMRPFNLNLGDDVLFTDRMSSEAGSSRNLMTQFSQERLSVPMNAKKKPKRSDTLMLMGNHSLFSPKQKSQETLADPVNR